MAPGTTWPLVGRDEELAWLLAAHADGTGGAVLVGAAGVGKTRLVAEFLARAEREGAAVFRTAVTASAATVPFGAFAGVLPVAPGTDRLALFQSAAVGLREQAEGRPSIVAVDDAHVLDDGSAALVHHLAASGSAFVVLTVRSGPPVPDPVVALWKDGLAARLDLQPLSGPEAARLLTEVLGGQVDTATARRLWEQSEGNALFLRELVASGLELGTLVERGGVWAAPAGLGPGPRLAELIDKRIGTVSADEQALLEILAVGEPLGADLLRAVTSPEVPTELEDRGLIRVEPSGRRRNVRLAHPLYAERVAAGLGVLRRDEISRRLADAVDETGARRADDTFRIAAWRLDGGGAIEPETLVVAARRALALHDQDLAERLARAAADAGGGSAAIVELGNALYWQGRHEDVLELLGSTAGTPRDDRDRSQAAILEGSTWFFGLGDGAAAERALLAVEADIADPAWRADVVAHRAGLAVYSGRITEGLDVALSVLDDPLSGDRACARAWAPVVLALALSGRTGEAEAATPTALDVSFRLVDELPSLVGAVLVSRCVGLWLAGELVELARSSEALLGPGEPDPADETRGFRAFLLGRAHLARGLVPEAILQLREAAAMLREQDPGRVLAWCLSGLAHARALAGDAEGAEAALTECDEERSAAFRVWEAELLLARAWARFAAGERSAARTLAVDAADLARTLGAPAVEVVALHDALRLGAGEEVTDRLLVTAGAVDGRFAPLAVGHATALRLGDGDGLDAVARAFEEIGALLLAAEAAAEAAAAHEAAGRSGARLASIAHAHRLADRCGGARSPALAGLDAPVPLAGLTAREREVAELAARGLSNPEIAERLFVSVRTVHNHLAHVFAKLGITRRGDLAPLFAGGK